jgi:hypothetical protein
MQHEINGGDRFQNCGNPNVRSRRRSTQGIRQSARFRQVLPHRCASMASQGGDAGYVEAAQMSVGSRSS